MKLFKYIITSIVLLVIVFIIINIPDQKTNKDAYEVLNRTSEEVIIDGNAYFPFVGL